MPKDASTSMRTRLAIFALDREPNTSISPCKPLPQTIRRMNRDIHTSGRTRGRPSCLPRTVPSSCREGGWGGSKVNPPHRLILDRLVRRRGAGIGSRDGALAHVANLIDARTVFVSQQASPICARITDTSARVTAPLGGPDNPGPDPGPRSYSAPSSTPFSLTSAS